MFPSHQLFSVIDCLSLAASLNGNTQTNEHFTVTESWSKLVTLLKAFLEQDLDKSGGYLVGLCGNGSSSTGSWSSADRVMPQLGGVMTRLLVAADREQTASMFQLLHKEVYIHSMSSRDRCNFTCFLSCTYFHSPVTLLQQPWQCAIAGASFSMPDFNLRVRENSGNGT